MYGPKKKAAMRAVDIARRKNCTESLTTMVAKRWYSRWHWIELRMEGKWREVRCSKISTGGSSQKVRKGWGHGRQTSRSCWTEKEQQVASSYRTRLGESWEWGRYCTCVCRREGCRKSGGWAKWCRYGRGNCWRGFRSKDQEKSRKWLHRPTMYLQHSSAHVINAPCSIDGL